MIDMQNSTFNPPKAATPVKCTSGNTYKVFLSADEPMMYNEKTKTLDICTETDNEDSIECMMEYYKIDRKTAKSYIDTSD